MSTKYCTWICICGVLSHTPNSASQICIAFIGLYTNKYCTCRWNMLTVCHTVELSLVCSGDCVCCAEWCSRLRGGGWAGGGWQRQVCWPAVFCWCSGQGGAWPQSTSHGNVRLSLFFLTCSGAGFFKLAWFRQLLCDPSFLYLSKFSCNN